MDDGQPIAYPLLEEGTVVRSSDGDEIGHVKRVLAVPEDDIFDGLIVATDGGDRFVDADGVASIHERAVALELDRDEAARLPEPSPSASAMELDASDVTESSASERAHRIWNLISGKW